MISSVLKKQDPRRMTVVPSVYAAGHKSVTWNVGNLKDLRVANDIAPASPRVVIPGSLAYCYAILRVPPAGASVIFDIIRVTEAGATASIFGATKLVIPAGTTGWVEFNTWASSPFVLNVKDWFQLNCTQIGSTTPGRLATIQLGWE